MKFDPENIRIRLTLVDPEEWEPLDLYFKFIDTPLSKQWFKEMNRIKQGPHSIRESSLKTNSNSSNITSQQCLSTLQKLVKKINLFYDQIIDYPIDIEEETLNYLHECYEKYGVRLDKHLREKWWDTAYKNIPPDSPFAKRWPGINFDEDMHQSFIYLNEWIHKSETFLTDKNNSPHNSPSGVVTYSLNPRTDFNLTEDDYLNLVKFPHFGDFCLGYNTLGKNLEHIVLDQDQEALDRGAIFPQETWSSEVYVYLGSWDSTVYGLVEYKKMWDSLQVTEKTGAHFGDWITNREGYLKIAEFDKDLLPKFYNTKHAMVNIDFSKYTKVKSIEFVPAYQLAKTGEKRIPRWKEIPKNEGKVIERIEGNYSVITWVLNNACTYDCRYCPDMLHNGPNTRWSWEQISPFLDEVFRQYPGSIRFSLSGGEPTVSPFFPELVRKISKKGGFIGITTNLTRSIRYIKENFGYLKYAACSFHPSMVFNKKIDDEYDFIEKVKIGSEYTYMPVRVMMDPEYWDQTVKFIEELKNETDTHISLVYIQNQYGASPKKICDISYTSEQIQYILDFDWNTSAKKPIKSKINTTASPAEMATVIYENGDIERINDSQPLINAGETRFFDYTCFIGKESLFINYDGSIKKGNCAVGGVVGNIENFEEIDWFDVKRPIRCDIGWCQCGADVPISKRSPK